MVKRITGLLTVGILTLTTLTGCISARLARPLPFGELTDKTAAAGRAGYTDSNGVPSLAERFSKRPGLKVAILQYGLYVQGDLPWEYTDVLHSSTIDGYATTTTYTTYAKTVLDGIQIPGLVGIHLATDGVRKLEAALTEAGFQVIPTERIAKTKAYEDAYGSFPMYAVVEKGDFKLTSMAAGWTGFAPLGYRLKAPSGVVAIGQAHWIWPNADALKKIKAELGEDVLFLLVANRLQNHKIVETGGKPPKRTRVGEFSGNIAVSVTDPDFVGYGIGGFGHIITNLDMNLTTTPRPEFVRGVGNGNRFETDWNVLVRDAELANSYYAKGIADVMKEKKAAK